MLSLQPFVLRFLSSCVAPIAGRDGQLLVVRPGHPTHTLSVYDPLTRCVVRHQGPEADVSRVIALESAGVLEFLSREDREGALGLRQCAAELQCEVPYAEPRGRPALALV